MSLGQDLLSVGPRQMGVYDFFKKKFAIPFDVASAEDMTHLALYFQASGWLCFTLYAMGIITVLHVPLTVITANDLKWCDEACFKLPAISFILQSSRQKLCCLYLMSYPVD